MTKKFVNLPSVYKKLLDDIKYIFTRETLEDLASNDLSYNEVLVLYNKIEELCSNNNCNSYDLNKMINYYDKKNSIIEILKRIACLRNKYIVYYAKKSEYWDNNLNDIKIRIKKILGKDISTNTIEKYFVKILKKYKYDWDGLWAIIDVNKKGSIKNINLFDLDDFNELVEYINKN